MDYIMCWGSDNSRRVLLGDGVNSLTGTDSVFVLVCVYNGAADKLK